LRARGRRGAEAALPVLVAVLTVLAFLPALRAGFVTWDDNRNFLDNAAWRGLGGEQLRWMWTTFHMGHYVPLTWMTLGLDYELRGMDPVGYHLHNVILHAVNAMLVFALARRLFRVMRATAEPSLWSIDAPAAVAALLFAVHPLRVESVAWITERRDVLSMAFCLTSVVSYLRYTEQTERASRVWYGASVIAFAAALLSKATSMSLPAVLLLLNVYPLRRLGGPAGFVGAHARRVYAEVLPFGVLAAAVATLSIVALDPPGQLPVGAKLAVSAYSLAFYVAKTVWPTNLAPLYEMPKVIDPLAARYLVSYLAAIGLTTAAWVVRRRYPGVTAAWFSFLLVVLPMLGLVQNGPQIAADRYTYHAAPALALLAGAAVATSGRATIVRYALAGALIMPLMVATWRQTVFWQTSERLWTRVLAVDPNSSVAEIALGDLMISEGRIDEAVRHYGRGVVLDPQFAGGFNNLGVALARQGNVSEAVVQYRQALALDPDFGDAHTNLGVALSQQGQFAEAVEHFTRAIATDSANADAAVNLGNAIVRLGKPADAITHYARAASLRPSHADTHLNWGVALAQVERFAEAAERFRRVLELDPGRADAREYLDRIDAMRAAQVTAGSRK
jgi:Tfp pilus assembly protein PilF